MASPSHLMVSESSPSSPRITPLYPPISTDPHVQRVPPRKPRTGKESPGVSFILILRLELCPAGPSYLGGLGPTRRVRTASTTTTHVTSSDDPQHGDNHSSLQSPRANGPRMCPWATDQLLNAGHNTTNPTAPSQMPGRRQTPMAGEGAMPSCSHGWKVLQPGPWSTRSACTQQQIHQMRPSPGSHVC